MLDNLPQLLSPVTTPDIYHVRPIRLDCDACDAPSGQEHRWETFEAYADYCNYGSRYGRESIILGCAEMVRKLTFYVLKRGKVHRKRYHTVGSDLYGAGLLAIVKATSDPAKFRPVGQGADEVVYCDRTGEVWEGGDDEITAIRKYLRTVARRAMWDEFRRGRLIYVLPSTARDARRRGEPEAPEEKHIGHDAFAAIEAPGSQDPFLAIEVEEVIRKACTEPLDAALIRLKYKGYTYPKMGQELGISPHRARRAVNRIYEAVCRTLDLNRKPMGRGRRSKP